jgi:hypothetical protein
VAGYGAVLLSLELAWLLRELRRPALRMRMPFLLSILAVMVSSWHGGLGAGVLATGLGDALHIGFALVAGRAGAGFSDEFAILASYLVTRDDDLLSLGTYEAMTIVTPEAFLTLLWNAG